jgi:hypothetical protein
LAPGPLDNGSRSLCLYPPETGQPRAWSRTHRYECSRSRHSCRKGSVYPRKARSKEARMGQKSEEDSDASLCACQVSNLLLSSASIGPDDQTHTLPMGIMPGVAQLMGLAGETHPSCPLASQSSWDARTRETRQVQFRNMRSSLWHRWGVLSALSQCSYGYLRSEVSLQ